MAGRSGESRRAGQPRLPVRTGFVRPLPRSATPATRHHGPAPSTGWSKCWRTSPAAKGFPPRERSRLVLSPCSGASSSTGTSRRPWKALQAGGKPVLGRNCWRCGTSRRCSTRSTASCVRSTASPIRSTRGECLAIVGESGSGKTVGVLSILRLIPTPPGRIVGGSILFKGTDLLSLDDASCGHSRQRDLDGLPGSDDLAQPGHADRRPDHRELSAHERLSRRQARGEGGRPAGDGRHPAPASALDDYPHQFSGGMRQRVMIAMALSCSPQLIIADEPTTALDVTIQAQIVELVKRLQSELGTAVIWISHDLGVVARLADRWPSCTRARSSRRRRSTSSMRGPRHPYTVGLLQFAAAARRRRKDEAARRSAALPPNLIGQPRGCPFAPRCAFGDDRCSEETPPLREVAAGHASPAGTTAGSRVAIAGAWPTTRLVRVKDLECTSRCARACSAGPSAR